MNTVPDLSCPLVATAYTVAVRAHKGAFRRDRATPYIRHVEQVMLRTPSDPVLQAVAACHDVLEDTSSTPEDLLKAGLSVEVLRGVSALTRLPSETYEAFIQRIKAADGGKWVPVKVADNLANLSDQPTQAQIVRYARSLLTLLS